ncbi:MAG: cob(I)yrinic acid a,c-diamide adenosyltransferase [Acidimicrobiales bacterium]
MRIYTRRGDDGTTGLLFGGRVRKDDAAVEACGAVDEAQAAVGVARASTEPGSELDGLLIGLERDLWVLMAEVATAPENRDRLVGGQTAVTAAMVERLEPIVDEVTGRFEAPTEFVLPGQSVTAAALDVARTAARRAERRALSVAPSDSFVVPYLNRLSDLLWTLARWQEGRALPARTEEQP